MVGSQPSPGIHAWRAPDSVWFPFPAAEEASMRAQAGEALSSQSGSGASTIVMTASGSKAIRVASISSAPMRSDLRSSSRVFSWPLTPGKSSNQPIHQPSRCLTIARYFIASPHKRDVQILADLASQLVYNLAVPRHLRLEISSLKDAMSLAFTQQIRVMILKMFDELVSFHSVVLPANRADLPSLQISFTGCILPQDTARDKGRRACTVSSTSVVKRRPMAARWLMRRAAWVRPRCRRNHSEGRRRPSGCPQW